MFDELVYFILLQILMENIAGLSEKEDRDVIRFAIKIEAILFNPPRKTRGRSEETEDFFKNGIQIAFCYCFSSLRNDE